MKTKMKTKIKKPSYADLARKVLELQAQAPCTGRLALKTIDKASDDHMMASAVIVTVTALGGREIVSPFAIRDGLSKATIDAIKADILKTMALDRITP